MSEDMLALIVIFPPLCILVVITLTFCIYKEVYVPFKEAREERLKEENEKFLIKNRTQLKESNA